MNQTITKEQRWLSNRYIFYRLLTNLFFLGAVWLYFYRIFITDQQIGLLDGFAFAIGLIAEVPSGALADRFGRDKLVKLGQLFAGGGLLVQALGSSLVPFFIGQSIMMIGISFVSGADEALFYEKIKFDPISVNWRRLIIRGSQVALIGSLFATVAGGWLHTINPRIPWILTGLSLLSSILIIWSIKDNCPVVVKKKFLIQLKEYLGTIKSGFSQFWTPKLSAYVPIIVIVQGLFYAIGYGILRLVLLDRFYFSPFLGSFVIASSSLIAAVALALIHKYSGILSEKKVILSISLVASAGLLLSVADIGMWGYFVILFLYAGEHILYPFMSEALNSRAGEGQRATVLSVASFLRTLPYVILAPIIGYLNMYNKLEYFLIFWAVLIMVAIMLYLSLKRKGLYLDMAKIG